MNYAVNANLETLSKPWTTMQVNMQQAFLDSTLSYDQFFSMFSI